MEGGGRRRGVEQHHMDGIAKQPTVEVVPGMDETGGNGGGVRGQVR
jgi:hypothetical protein